MNACLRFPDAELTLIKASRNTARGSDARSKSRSPRSLETNGLPFHFGDRPSPLPSGLTFKTCPALTYQHPRTMPFRSAAINEPHMSALFGSSSMLSILSDHEYASGGGSLKMPKRQVQTSSDSTKLAATTKKKRDHGKPTQGLEPYSDISGVD